MYPGKYFPIERRVRIHFIKPKFKKAKSLIFPLVSIILDRSESGSRVLMTKNWEKFTVEKKTKKIFESKTTIYLSLGLHKGFLRHRRSLQTSKENIQHFKI
jgi:hypothetical protein